MTRTARLWIEGGLEHDEESCFQDYVEFCLKLKDLQASRQIGLYKLQLHGEEQTSEAFRFPEGDVELDIVPLTPEGIPVDQQQQMQYEAQRLEDEHVWEILDKHQRETVEDRDRKTELMADARARRLAKEQERKSRLELELAQYKAAVGEYFNSIGTVASQCFGGSRRGYHNSHERHD